MVVILLVGGQQVFKELVYCRCHGNGSTAARCIGSILRTQTMSICATHGHRLCRPIGAVTSNSVNGNTVLDVSDKMNRCRTTSDVKTQQGKSKVCLGTAQRRSA